MPAAVGSGCNISSGKERSPQDKHHSRSARPCIRSSFHPAIGGQGWVVLGLVGNEIGVQSPRSGAGWNPALPSPPRQQAGITAVNTAAIL